METCLRCYAILVCLTLAPLTAGWTTALAHETHTSEAVDQTAPAVSTNQARGSQDKPEPRSPTGRLSDAFPNILLWTQDNTPVRFYDDLVKDKIVIINFMYTTCSDICPGTAQNLTYVQELLGKRVGRDIHMLSISIEPQIDTPEALKRYSEVFGGPKAGWFYLTGDYDEIDTLRRTLGVYDLDPIIDADKTQHSGIVTFGNDRTNRWATLLAMMDSRQLAKTILWITRDPKQWYRGRNPRS